MRELGKEHRGKEGTFLSFFFLIFIYLVAPGLSCGSWAP